MNIICPSSEMRLKPSTSSPLANECLFGEKIEILENHNEWALCRLTSDKYEGWIKKKTIGRFKLQTHRVLSLRTFMYQQKNVKSNCIGYLPLGSKLHVKGFFSEWAEIYLSDQFYNTAFVPKNHIVKIDHRVKDWVGIAEQFVNTPYKWGGRNSLGIDCSALIQLSYEAYGFHIPRDTKDQINLKKAIISDLKNLRRGHVIFWPGHVGIMVDRLNCLHANAFHMKTVIEPLKKIKERSKNNDIKIIFDFNK